MTLYLLTTMDYSAVVGYAECTSSHDRYGRDESRVIGYDTDRQQVFTRKGLTNAERRAHTLGTRIVASGYFGLDNGRPENVSAPAYAVAEAVRRGLPFPTIGTEGAA